MEYPHGYNEGPCCGILAISVLTDKPFTDVWNWFRKKNNRPGQWKGSTFPMDYPEALKFFGFNESEIIFKAESKNKPFTKHPIPLHYWVSIFTKKYPPGTKFLVITKGHTMAVVDGIVCDQSGIKPVNEHSAKQRRVTQAWIVK